MSSKKLEDFLKSVILLSLCQFSKKIFSNILRTYFLTQKWLRMAIFLSLLPKVQGSTILSTFSAWVEKILAHFKTLKVQIRKKQLFGLIELLFKEVSKLLYYLPSGPRAIPPRIPLFGIVIKYAGHKATAKNKTPKVPTILLNFGFQTVI